MKPANKVSITPELLARFKAYHEANRAWGSLHVVLDDNNLKTHFVEGCLSWAIERNDVEGAELAKILLTLSMTQRGRISKEC